jgi:hypothetical protein
VADGLRQQLKLRYHLLGFVKTNPIVYETPKRHARRKKKHANASQSTR